MVFSPNDPVGYLNRFAIHHPIRVEEIIIDSPTPVTV
jgi:hypothetical protein